MTMAFKGFLMVNILDILSRVVWSIIFAKFLMESANWDCPWDPKDY